MNELDRLKGKFEILYARSRLSHSAQNERNPLIDLFQGDEEVHHLRVNGQEIKDIIWHQLMVGKFSCTSPPCYCCNIVDQPCVHCFVCIGLHHTSTAASSHKLTLRRQTLEYRVDEYNSIGAVWGDHTTVDPTIETMSERLCCPDRRVYGRTIHEIFPIEDVTSVAVEECKVLVGEGAIAPDTLVVRLSGKPHVAVAIDAPQNGAEFAKVAMEAAEEARCKPAILDPRMRSDYLDYLQRTGYDQLMERGPAVKLGTATLYPLFNGTPTASQSPSSPLVAEMRRA